MGQCADPNDRNGSSRAVERLAAELRVLRDRTGISLRDLQRETYSSSSSLSRYLCGRALPPWHVVEALCRLASSDPNELRPLWERCRIGRRRAVGGRLGRDPTGRSDAEAALTGGSPLPVPAQLPADVPDFTGRAVEMSQLDELSNPRGHAPGTVLTIVVTGMAGVGKTALAVHWAHRVQHRFRDGVLYANLLGHAPAEPSRPIDVLARFLRAFGVRAERIPTGTEEAASLYRSVLADRRVLVVLDNAYDADQVRPLLPGGSRCVTLVTSRDRLTGLLAKDGARRIRLDVLSLDEAVRVIVGIVGLRRAQAEPRATAELAMACSRLPLALRIAAAQLLDHPHCSLADYVRELKEENLLIVLRVEADEQDAVRASFDLSYARLAPDVARLFRRVGLLPGPDFTVEVAAQLVGAGPQQTRRLLDRVLAKNLVSQHTPDRYSCHDLVRSYAHQRALAEESAHTRTATMRRLLCWYLATARRAARLTHPVAAVEYGQGKLEASAGQPLATADEAFEWFEADHVNLFALIRRALEHAALRPPCVELVATLGCLCRSRGYSADWERALRVALPATQEPLARAKLLTELVHLYTARGFREELIELCEQTIRAYRDAGEPRGEIGSVINLGCAHHRLGQIDQARQHYQWALRQARAIGHRRGELYALANLAAASRDDDDLNTAIRHSTAALAVSRSIGDEHGEADILDDLATSYRTAGQLDKALAIHRDSIAMASKLRDVPRHAEALLGLGHTHLATGHPDLAAPILEQAADMLSETGHQNLHATALSLLDTTRHAERRTEDHAGRR